MKKIYSRHKPQKKAGLVRKLLRTMKFVSFCLMLGLAAAHAETYSQSISMDIKNGSIVEVFNEIQRQSDYAIVYKDHAVSGRKVSITAENKEVLTVLDHVLEQTGLAYRIRGKQITIISKPAARRTATRFPQDSLITVRGLVVDAKDTDMPLVGVGIQVKDAGTSTVSDKEGHFTVRVHPQAILTISSIGYRTVEVGVAGRTSIRIALEEQVSAIDEVVVVGYGEQRKINLTGAVGSIRAEDFAARPIVSVNQALQGQLPGVTVVNTNGRPGTNNTNIRIRGINTLNNAGPLVVIDGVPGGDMSILNPEDVESVSVLKDAASASIYGVRGANGVILVTTKKGRAVDDGKADINYNGYYGMQMPVTLPEMANSWEYMELMNEALVNGRNNPAWTDEQIRIAREGSDPDYFANTRWIDEIYNSHAPQHSHNLSVNGGMGQSTYRLAYGYLNQGGMVTGDNFNSHRHNIRARFNTTLFDRLTIDGNVGYIDRNYLASAENPSSTGGPLNAAMAISPLVPVRFSTGGWGYHGGQRNPIAVTTDGGTDKFNSQEFTGNLQASLHIWDGLRLRGQLGNVRYHTRRTVMVNTIDYIDPYGELVYQNNVPNRMEVRSFTRNYINLMGMLEYEKTFADAHYIKAMVAASQEEDVNNDINASRTHFPVEGIPSLNIGTENQLNSNPTTQWALRSFFGRVNYAFKDRYLLEANFRRDGSSRFHPSLRWNWFGSVSGGWVFSEEPFFRGRIKDIVDMGKIRFSYGTQGNDRVENASGSLMNFGYMNTYASRTTMPIGNVLTNAFWQPNVGNPLLSWESSLKSNVGFDLTLLGNRLNVVADYYVNKTNDILLAVPLPDVFGANFPVQNAGSVENRGWEVQVGWRSTINTVGYGVTANLADVRNRVTDYGGAPPVIGDRIRRVGDPIDAFYGLVADRIAQEADFEYNPMTGAYIPRFPHIEGDPISPGDIIYRVLTPTTDPNKPYDFNDPEREYISLDKDRTVIGNTIPRYTYGLQGDLAWKGFDFSFFIQGVGKVNGLLSGQARHAFINQSTMPHRAHLDRWTPENPNASYPRLVYNQTYNTRLSTFWLEDASYLRLKNIQLGYTLPQRALGLLGVGKVRVYASAENLLTLTNFYSAFDPEVPVNTAGGVYPQMKTFVFGISANLK
ncbi:TonB-linked outer membrane protein, SusC/RagA family [Parapedobacter composti]|uniref:TonB-linked outer membrane protein, SusC/RagA family n=2 Tax=Parapedobacter composti TaxID=623281 RepID=A0A1I1L4Z8_9SPHI|nr:TonB-linked outer membrane protein, SusC/RagA family [Parapedobacter composti]